MIRKLVGPDEIDAIVPLMQAFGGKHRKEVSLVQRIIYLVSNWGASGVWVGIDNDKVYGYSIVYITDGDEGRTAWIQEAFTAKEVGTDVKDALEAVKVWAQINGCSRVAAHTDRPEAICRKYGFQQGQTVIELQLGQEELEDGRGQRSAGNAEDGVIPGAETGVSLPSEGA
jgi:hypothetical protein